jgi:two-component system, chemotaxis family, protein-glutamate methylesterase/glutaminase
MSSPAPNAKRDVVVMGASVGGIDAFPKVLSQLPVTLDASVVIVQHGPANGARVLVDILRRSSRLPVDWAEQGARHEPRHVYVAPADLHLTFSDGHFNLTASARENYARPSINRLFRSAAAHYGSRTVGVLLSGLLDDGVAGMVAISRVGGATVIQDPQTAIAADLPRNGIAAVPTSRVVPLSQIGEVVTEATRSPAPSTSVPEPIKLESEADTRPSRPEELDRFAWRTSETCDECGGPMWHVNDGGPPRYRCYLGHAMTARDRLQKFDEEVERALWNAVRALDERGTTLDALAVDSRNRQDHEAAAEFEEQSREAFEQSRLAYAFMQQLTQRR